MTTPSWVSLLADDGLVSAKELAEWLECPKRSVDYLRLSGQLPAPCQKRTVFAGNHQQQAYKWKAKTIRDWIKAGKPRVGK